MTDRLPQSVRMNDKVQIYKTKNGDWSWRRIAGNGLIISIAGEGYTHEDWAWQMACDLNLDLELASITNVEK